MKALGGTVALFSGRRRVDELEVELARTRAALAEVGDLDDSASSSNGARNTAYVDGDRDPQTNCPRPRLRSPTRNSPEHSSRRAPGTGRYDHSTRCDDRLRRTPRSATSARDIWFVVGTPAATCAATSAGTARPGKTGGRQQQFVAKRGRRSRTRLARLGSAGFEPMTARVYSEGTRSTRPSTCDNSNTTAH
jgi:hypothetical protein